MAAKTKSAAVIPAEQYRALSGTFTDGARRYVATQEAAATAAPAADAKADKGKRASRKSSGGSGPIRNERQRRAVKQMLERMRDSLFGKTGRTRQHLILEKPKAAPLAEVSVELQDELAGLRADVTASVHTLAGLRASVPAQWAAELKASFAKAGDACDAAVSDAKAHAIELAKADHAKAQEEDENRPSRQPHEWERLARVRDDTDLAIQALNAKLPGELQGTIEVTKVVESAGAGTSGSATASASASSATAAGGSPATKGGRRKR